MTPRRPEQFEAIRESSREKIIQAAIELFAKEGYLNVSVSKIALQAGVSKGLMYNYFPSKEALLQSIMDLIVRDMQDFVAEVMDDKVPPEKMIENIIRVTFRIFRERKEFYTTITPLITQHAVSQKIEVQMHELLGSFIHQLEQLFKKLKVKNAGLEAFKLAALLDGIPWHYLFLFKEDYPLKEIEESVVKQYKTLIEHK